MNTEKVILGKSFLTALCEVMGLESHRVRRVVLDATTPDVVIVYVELIGDTRLLQITPTFGGIEKRVVRVESME